MGKVIRVAIAGQGRSGYGIHVKYLRTNANFKIVAVADELPERRQQAIDELGCEAYCNYQELLDKGPAVDLFVNATPSRFHVETSLAAIKAGFNVISEKPSAPTVAEFDKIIAAAKKAKNYAEADRIRAELLERGIVLIDTPNGTTFERK